ncbi:MAG: DNA2/NAM7 family helicase, partial [Oligoflexales bacterium]|nr:DNA2/NAM7 family helicase [Oligoflexales bacterium]
DEILKQRFLAKLGAVARSIQHSARDGGTSPLTTLQSLLDDIKNCGCIESGTGAAAFREFREKLFETFPIFLCRKQVVPFLFPCRERLFDLVIVDEAGQCRVDDALPILYRAKKLMVVGDDKQTVLAKNSIIDDYLFNEFALDEHLRSTQARGIKGGGSHLFGLVKSIKQASVMLDEHYRCPPEIIEYSNRYVYGGELKVMQWSYHGKKPSVVVDYSEEKVESNLKKTSGKFKGIETEMVDRYLEFVARKIREIEKETGRKINMETDVALCYFLLKNEPYVKSVKGEFLRKLGRGEDVLDGAGAALQGKEREYIFYLWDVSRANMMSFRHGDDEDKRKGELNVLMSRPKIRAYHYLHQSFSTLDHKSATITDYLWKAYKAQSEKPGEAAAFEPRRKRPGPEHMPWTRSSGELIDALVRGESKHLAKDMKKRDLSRLATQTSVIVGDPRYKVDLMIIPKNAEKSVPAIGIVDLCSFEANENAADEIVDYFFQLQRAVPPIDPVFLFIHELSDENAQVYGSIRQKIKDVS